MRSIYTCRNHPHQMLLPAKQEKNLYTIVTLTLIIFLPYLYTLHVDGFGCIKVVFPKKNFLNFVFFLLAITKNEAP